MARNMANYAAFSGIANGIQQGLQAYRQAKLARMNQERFNRQETEATPSIDADSRLHLPPGTKMTRSEAIQSAEKLADLAAMAKFKYGNQPGGMKLKPGERYNAQTDTVEQIPGSDLYNANALKHEKDLQARNAANASAKIASDKVDAILADPEIIKSQFGGYNALASQFMNPGAKNQIESLKSNLKAQGLQLMKGGGGIGAISEAEWPIMEGMIDKLDPRMSEEQATQALREIKAKFQQLGNNTENAYQTTWGGSQYVNPKRAGLGAEKVAPENNKRYKIISVEH